MWILVYMSDSHHTHAGDPQSGDAELTVRDDPDHDRFDLWLGDELVGILGYRDESTLPSGEVSSGTELALMHTVVREEYGGRGFATALVSRALDEIRDRGLHVRPICTYVQQFLTRHPQYDDLVAG